MRDFFKKIFSSLLPPLLPVLKHSLSASTVPKGPFSLPTPRPGCFLGTCYFLLFRASSPFGGDASSQLFSFESAAHCRSSPHTSTFCTHVLPGHTSGHDSARQLSLCPHGSSTVSQASPLSDPSADLRTSDLLLQPHGLQCVLYGPPPADQFPEGALLHFTQTVPIEGANALGTWYSAASCLDVSGKPQRTSLSAHRRGCP